MLFGNLVVYMGISLRQVLKKYDMSCTMYSTDSRWGVEFGAEKLLIIHLVLQMTAHFFDPLRASCLL
jgi:hypothetical protein